MSKILRVGITHGDINGIAYELILRTMADPELLELCTPVIFGSQRVARDIQASLHLDPLPLNIVSQASAAVSGRINLVDVCTSEDLHAEPGQQTEAALEAEAQSLNAALEAWNTGDIDVLVTAPGHLDNDLESHSLADFARRTFQIETPVFDWVLGGNIRTLVLHPAVASTQLGEGLAKERLFDELRHINSQMRADFRLIRPRLAVIADQQWHDGKELLDEGILAFGPFQAGPFVEAGSHRHYDAVLFINAERERSQVLDSLESDETYGYVSGLPLVLTYPLMSVSYDIAGKGCANIIPFRHSIYAAIDIWHNRRAHWQATQHPLPKLWVAKGRDDVKLDLSKDD